uniref:CSON001524 protein n=1 Tax=Culicoides sonorensis TaxID=179676 RepID=A0A336MKT7_CULSO
MQNSFYTEILSLVLWSSVNMNVMGECRDYQGRIFTEGQHLLPGPEPCKLCVCKNGHIEGCKDVLCAPPQDCKSGFKQGDNCCEFICMDGAASGITATLSLTLLFFLINRLRNRKSRHRGDSRQQSEDQRSIGSIGYLSGNYMGGTGDMGFTYDGNPNHYQLWKPPGNYFPRGEAPPPYEEAIALAQAESMNTCTVSVATTHRTLPLNVCNSEPDISSTTTNLINININNAGNITAVAAGENHILSSSSFGRSPSNTLPRTTENGLIQLPADPSSSIYPCNQQMINLPREIPCTLQNCELNTTTITNQICNIPIMGRASGQCLVRSQMPKENQPSNQSIATVSNSIQNTQLLMSGANSNSNSMSRSMNNSTIATILPPPLFSSEPMNSNLDTEPLIVPVENHTGDIVELPKTSNSSTTSSKRYHRTIPRNLATTDALMATLKPNNNSTSATTTAGNSGLHSPNNKKAACQCPVQHVPMTYMGSNQINAAQQNTQNIFLSTLTTKLNNVAAKQATSAVGKSTSFPSTSGIQTISKPQEIVPNLYQGPNYDPTNSIRRLKPNLLKLEAAHPNALGITSSNTPRRKIDPALLQQQQQQSHDITPKPILKSSSRSSLTESRSQENLLSASYPMIDAVAKTVTEPNPVLPPKLYKSSSQKQNHHRDNGSYYSNSKIHAITRPSETAQFSILNDHHSAESSLRMRHTSNKTLPRTESTYSDVDKVISSRQPSQHVTSGNNTLPKNKHHNARSSSSITEVVNKVPSIITLPHPKTSNNGNQSSKPPSGKQNHQRSRSGTRTPTTPPHTNNSSSHVIHRHQGSSSDNNKPLPVLTTSTNCTNPKQHFLPNDTSLDDDYLSECENCKTAHGSKYYLDEEVEGETMETMTLQRKMPETNECDEQQGYYRVSATLPSNTNKQKPVVKSREPWFATIPASSSSEGEEDETAE